MEGKVLSDAEVAVLSTMTSKKDVYAQLVGTLLAPVANLLRRYGRYRRKGRSCCRVITRHFRSVFRSHF